MLELLLKQPGFIYSVFSHLLNFMKESKNVYIEMNQTMIVLLMMQHIMIGKI